uniref:Uncharacterized protein n=1 Tax=Arundo donax TaxID=35708 RepID=A0A0A9CRP6_ARUDO
MSLILNPISWWNFRGPLCLKQENMKTHRTLLGVGGWSSARIFPPSIMQTSRTSSTSYMASLRCATHASTLALRSLLRSSWVTMASMRESVARRPLTSSPMPRAAQASWPAKSSSDAVHRFTKESSTIAMEVPCLPRGIQPCTWRKKVGGKQEEVEEEEGDS